MRQHEALQTISKQAAYVTNSHKRVGPLQTMSVLCSREPIQPDCLYTLTTQQLHTQGTSDM